MHRHQDPGRDHHRSADRFGEVDVIVNRLEPFDVGPAKRHHDHRFVGGGAVSMDHAGAGHHRFPGSHFAERLVVDLDPPLPFFDQQQLSPGMAVPAGPGTGRQPDASDPSTSLLFAAGASIMTEFY